MPRYIIHHAGAYNFYTTVADGACYERGMTLAELEEITRFEYGQEGMRELPERLQRAHETGCSGHDWTLDDCISGVRHPHPMTRDEFIARYLTLPAPDQRVGVA